MRIALTLAPLVLFAATPAAPPSTPSAAPGLAAVNQSTLQTFTKEGFRALLLRASAMNVARERVDLTDMNLSVFSGDAADIKLGRLPLLVSAAKVNCGMSNRPPSISRKLKFIRSCASAKIL